VFTDKFDDFNVVGFIAYTTLLIILALLTASNSLFFIGDLGPGDIEPDTYPGGGLLGLLSGDIIYLSYFVLK
jgi:hypothetical protein